MEITQVASFVNSATGEILGESAVLAEDLRNVVDIGTEVFNANAVDAYVRNLVNHIGRVIFVDRAYAGGAPSVLRDSWEYGSVCEKITAFLPDAEDNEDWSLEDRQTYSNEVFYKPTISVKFFNKRDTFMIPISITEMQVKQSFSSPVQLNAFVSMIFNAVEKSMTIKMDALIMRTINNMIGETVYADYQGASISSTSGIKAVNLLKLYNTQFSKSITAADALTDPDFIRFASYTIGVYASRMRKMSTLFNVGGMERFTPAEMLHIVMLTDFRRAADVYLQSDTFHDEFTALPAAEDVPYWQGSGTDYALSSTGKVYVKTASNHDVTVTGVLAVMFDNDALGVSCLDRRVTTHYNAKAEFYNNFFKVDAGYWNDLNEQFVVFFAA